MTCDSTYKEKLLGRQNEYRMTGSRRSCLGPVLGGGTTAKGHVRTWRVMGMLDIWTVVVATWVDTFVKSY